MYKKNKANLADSKKKRRWLQFSLRKNAHRKNLFFRASRQDECVSFLTKKNATTIEEAAVMQIEQNMYGLEQNLHYKS